MKHATLWKWFAIVMFYAVSIGVLIPYLISQKSTIAFLIGALYSAVIALVPVPAIIAKIKSLVKE